MHQTTIPPPSRRAAAVRRIKATNVAGPDAHHSRVMNPETIHGLLRGSPDSILGIARFERIPFKDVLDAQASVTGYSPSPTVTTGDGNIAPASTLQGLEDAARRIDDVAGGGSRFLVATGHPGSLLLFCVELVRLIRSRGGDVLEPARGLWAPPMPCG